MKKAEGQRIGVFELNCGVGEESPVDRRSNQSILKEINS